MAVDQETFVRQMTGLQDRLFAYILTMLPDVQEAADVLQETNVVLWRKMNDLEAEQSFEAWACRVAYYEVLSFRRDRKRDKLLFDDALLERIAARFPASPTADSAASVALEQCLGRLPIEQRDMITARYRDDASMAELAQASGKPEGTISVTLHRIRQTLLECIRGKLRAEAES